MVVVVSVVVSVTILPSSLDIGSSDFSVLPFFFVSMSYPGVTRVIIYFLKFNGDGLGPFSPLPPEGGFMLSGDQGVARIR